MTEVSLEEAFRNDPMTPHLLDILSHPAAEGLILGGGFGMRLKQPDLARHPEQATLIQPHPACSTDARLGLFLADRMLDRAGAWSSS